MATLPAFDPTTYVNQHYVPEFFQRRFAGSNGVLSRRTNSGHVRQVSHTQQWVGMGLLLTIEEHPGRWATYALTPIA